MANVTGIPVYKEIGATPAPASRKERARVVIVGAGAAGCTMALLLARYGIPTTVIEERQDTRLHPAAHVINARTLEIWNQASPALGRALEAITPPIDTVNIIRWCTDVRSDRGDRPALPTGSARRGSIAQSSSDFPHRPASAHARDVAGSRRRTADRAAAWLSCRTRW